MPVIAIFLYIVAALIFLLAVDVIITGWTNLKQISDLDFQKNYVLFVQITITFLSGIALAILTAAFGRSNERFRMKLTEAVNETTEKLRARLAQDTGTFLATLNSELTKSVNASTEKLKAELTMSGDQFRAKLDQVITKQHAGYHALWAAASKYFRALQKFEAAQFADQELKDADKACEEAHGQSLLIENKDESVFYDFWQEAAFLHEKGEAKRDLPEGLRSIWREEGRALGNKYDQLRELFKERLQS
jgi:hypothetical protein